MSKDKGKEKEKKAIPAVPTVAPVPAAAAVPVPTKEIRKMIEWEELAVMNVLKYHGKELMADLPENATTTQFMRTVWPKVVESLGYQHELAKLPTEKRVTTGTEKDKKTGKEKTVMRTKKPQSYYVNNVPTPDAATIEGWFAKAIPGEEFAFPWAKRQAQARNNFHGDPAIGVPEMNAKLNEMAAANATLVTRIDALTALVTGLAQGLGEVRGQNSRLLKRTRKLCNEAAISLADEDTFKE